MTQEQKVIYLTTVLGSDDSMMYDDYLDIAKAAIINHLYSMVGLPENPELDPKYDSVQMESVIAGFNIRGAEGQNTHAENGISRHFEYSGMLDYIESHVAPYVKVTV